MRASARVCFPGRALSLLHCALVFIQKAIYGTVIVKQFQLFSDRFFSAEHPGHRGESRLGRGIDQRAGRDKQ